MQLFTMVSDNKKIPVNCTLVGNAMVGKTSIAKSFLGTVEEKYVATIFDNYAGSVSVAGGLYTISIYDPTGQHDYANMRAFTYMQCDVIILCYNASDRKSFDDITSFWIPEIRRFRGKISPIFLVATQTDNMSKYKHNVVSRIEGEQLAKNIKAKEYIETSIKQPEQIKEMFDIVVMTALENRKKRPRKIQSIFGR